MKSLQQFLEDGLSLGCGNNLFTTPMGTMGMGGVAPFNGDPAKTKLKRKRKNKKPTDEIEGVFDEKTTTEENQ